MAANCLIYRRCRANAINKPLYHEDSFDATAFQRSCRDASIPTRIPKEKHITCLSPSFPFPPPSSLFLTKSWFTRFRLRIRLRIPPRDALCAAVGPRKIRVETRRGKWNWRSEMIDPPANILSLKVYKSPRIYTFRECIFCTYLHYICREYLRENGYENGRRDSLNIKRIFAGINGRVVTIGARGRRSNNNRDLCYS